MTEIQVIKKEKKQGGRAMTEKEFNANCIKSMETEPNVRFGGILCLMHYPVPEWAEEGTGRRRDYRRR